MPIPASIPHEEGDMVFARPDAFVRQVEQGAVKGEGALQVVDADGDDIDPRLHLTNSGALVA